MKTETEKSPATTSQIVLEDVFKKSPHLGVGLKNVAASFLKLFGEIARWCNDPNCMTCQTICGAHAIIRTIDDQIKMETHG